MYNWTSLSSSVNWSKHNGFVATGGGDDAITLCACEQGGGGGAVLARETSLPHAHAGDINCVR
jgi:hypothetical protein